MARRAAPDQGSSVSLFPFLSILACIIGALTLLIAALSMSQLQSGRDPEEVARAERFVQLEKKMKELRKSQAAARISLATYTPKLNALKPPVEQVAALEKQRAEALKQKRDPVDTDALKKDIDENSRILTEMDKQLDLGSQKLAGVKQELLSRKAPEKGPTVMVKPSRRGHNRNYAFAELGPKEVIVHHKDKEQKIPVGQVAKGKDFQKITDDCKARGRTLVVLVRQEGAKHYPLVEKTLKSRDLKYGKIPITGEGEIDLSLFSL